MRTAAQFVDPTSIMFLKLALAMLLGAVIGTERAVLAKQAAGMRTFGLVSMGACLFIIASNYVTTAYLGVADIQPLYIAAGIVTGIGFLGGGLIIFKGDTLHGVTTAAGLWIAAGLGMTVGFGMYAVAIFSTILTMLMLSGMWYVEVHFKHWFEEHHLDSGANGQSGSSTPSA